MTVRLSCDAKPVLTVVANITRPNLMHNGAPNNEHGFQVGENGSWVQALAGAGRHRLDIDVYLDAAPSAASEVVALNGSPICFSGGSLASCT